MPTFGRLELLGLIEDYRQGLVPLIVPLLKYQLNRYCGTQVIANMVLPKG